MLVFKDDRVQFCFNTFIQTNRNAKKVFSDLPKEVVDAINNCKNAHIKYNQARYIVEFEKNSFINIFDGLKLTITNGKNTFALKLAYSNISNNLLVEDGATTIYIYYEKNQKNIFSSPKNVCFEFVRLNKQFNEIYFESFKDGHCLNSTYSSTLTSDQKRALEQLKTKKTYQQYDVSIYNNLDGNQK